MGSIGTTSPPGLSIIIVGAGIGGLGAAVALSRKGFRVTVLEGKPALNEFGASIGVMANGVRIIEYYGLRERFEPIVSKANFIEARNGHTGKVIGRITQNAGNSSEIEFGAETWIIHRADYQRVLADAALANGAEIMFSANVTGVTTKSERPTVYLEDGRTLTADLVVGADGLRSAVRSAIPETSHAEPRKLFEQCWRITVPKEKMRGNPKLEWLLTCGNDTPWLAEGRYVLSWPMPAHRSFDVVCCVARTSDVPAGLWGVKDDPANVQKLFADFCPEVVELLSHIDGCVKWTLAELPPLTTCRSANGSVVLLGDAFHGKSEDL
jgi:salicylate hydroxylase